MPTDPSAQPRKHLISSTGIMDTSVAKIAFGGAGRGRTCRGYAGPVPMIECGTRVPRVAGLQRALVR